MLNRGVGGGFNICYEGDSFMSSAGDIVAKTNTFLTSIENNSFRWSWVDFAISGAGTGYPEASNNYMSYSGRLTDVAAVYKPVMAKKNILITHEGTNDMFYYLTIDLIDAPTTVLNTYNNYLAYYDAITGRASEGWKCILNTVVPRGGAAIDVDFEIARQNASDKSDTATLNGKLRADFDTATAYTRVFTSSLAKWAGCVLYDIGDDPDYGQAGQYTNATYFQDEVHPTTTMSQSIIDNYIGNAIKVLRDTTT